MASQLISDGGSPLAADPAAQEPIFAHIIRLVRTALNVPFAAVKLCAAHPSWLHAVNGLHVNHPDSLHPLWSAALAEPGGGLLAVNEIAADPRFGPSGDMDGAEGARSFVGVPLTLSSGLNVGVLYAADIAPRAFLAGECSMLTQLGDCVVRELELRERAASDDLTGFLTRKPFFDGLDRTLATFVENETPATLAILDLDHFKSINDQFGHAAGDRVLACVSEVCRTILGNRVSFGRLGGEEFAFAFPGIGLDEATEALCDLRAAIEAIRLAGVADMTVTGSIGVAGLSDDIPTVSAWCKMADAALYGAKQAGRNCVIVSRNTRALPTERPIAPLLIHKSRHELAKAGGASAAQDRGPRASVTPLRPLRSEAG